jgi:hypothetical protein
MKFLGTFKTSKTWKPATPFSQGGLPAGAKPIQGRTSGRGVGGRYTAGMKPATTNTGMVGGYGKPLPAGARVG